MPDSYRPRPYVRDSYNPRRGDPPPVYHFNGGSNYRPSPPPHGTDSYRPGDTSRPLSDRITYPSQNGHHRDEFAFRSGVDAPHFPTTRPTQPSANRSKRPVRHEKNENGRQRGRAGQRFKIATSDRPILRSGRASTPEQLLGMSEGRSRFLNPDDLSESEEDMDLESDEFGNETDGTPDESNPEPSQKKVRTVVPAKADVDAAPKWSNPDPYTVLPPPDESQAKKKDVVQLIRKAKVAREQIERQADVVTANDDFISFNFDDGPTKSADAESGEESSDTEIERRDRVPSIGPPRFSHLDALRPHRREQKENRDPEPPDNIPSKSSLQALRRELGSEVRKVRSRDESPHSLSDSRPRKRKREELDGTVLQKWLPLGSESPTPWCNPRLYRTEHVSRWLHHEIQDFYDYVKPRDFEDKVRNELIGRISRALRKHYPGSQVMAFGSFAAGLYLPTADMDLVLVSEEYRTRGQKLYGRDKNFLFRFKAQLERAKIAQPGGEVIFSAKVPIVKFIDITTGLRVDMSFENLTGVVAIDTFQIWRAEYPAMPIIVTLVKQFLLMRGLNEVFTGGIGGFTVTCLVTSLLQNMPAIQSKNMDPMDNLGQLLLDFFDLYGNKFNMYQTRICMEPPRYIPKDLTWSNGKMEKADRLSVMDPNTPDNDISQGSHKIAVVFQSFAEAFRLLQNIMAELHTSNASARKGASILGSIVAGDYSHFKDQRDRLWRLYERR